MIRKLTFICMCSLTLGVQAGEINRTNDSLKVIIPQTDLLKPVEPSYLKNVTTTSGWDSNWFLNVSGGATAFVGNPLGCEDLFGRVKPSLTVSIGKWFTPAIGTRVSFQGFQFKDCKLDNQDYRQLHADLLWNVTGRHYHARDRPWDIVPYVGLGIIHNEDNGNCPFAFSYGLMARYRLAQRLHLTMELGGTTTFDDFDNYGHSASREFGDNLFSVKAGLSFTIGKVGWKKVIDAKPFMKRNEQLVDYAVSLQSDNARLSRKNNLSVMAIAEMKKILEIEGLLEQYGNLFDKLNENAMPTENNGYPKNDYSGLNSLRARLMNKGYPIDGDSTGVDKIGNAPLRYRYHYCGGDSISINSCLADISNGKCLGSPIYFFFRLGMSTLTDSSQLINLDEIARVVKEYGLVVKVTGAADSATGNAVINNQLSENRADYILRLLEQRGVDNKKILKVSEGGIDRFNPDEANRHTKIELHLK